ncbi:hypothetical protein DSO57_1008577 [Entomophthora muscae]|uniref:Uncharacterized protein n=1 Tax=Entomophthora muscae TaxID=34485 RepID=A0ACC2RLW6_9FUNG|nr:hypothetical protein DSO57_1008577 [Entomophthora muscae]
MIDELFGEWKDKSTVLCHWSVNIKDWNPTEVEYDELLGLLNTSKERERLNKFKGRNDRLLGLMGKLLIYGSITQLAVVEIAAQEKKAFKDVWRDIRFSYNPQGRPCLAEYLYMAAVDFNISHHGDFVSLVVCSNGQVGIDVAKVEVPSSDETAEKFISWYKDEFSQEEWYRINNCSETIDYGKLNQFMEIWCLKESLLKGLGTGLQLPLSSVSFDLGKKPLSSDMKAAWRDTKVSIHQTAVKSPTDLNAKLDRWSFEEIYLDHKHCTSIAFRPNKEVLSNDPVFTHELKIWTASNFCKIVFSFLE